MGFDGYRIKAGMTGQAQQLDDAGTDMDGVSSAVRSRTTYSYDDAGGDDAASALDVEKSVAQGHPVPVDVSGKDGAHAMTIIAQEGDMLQVYNRS